MEKRPFALKAFLVILLGTGWVLALVFWISPPLHLEPANSSLLPPQRADAGQQAACRPPDEIERRRDQLALQMLETFRPDDSASFLRGAMMVYFAHASTARRGEKERVCPPIYLYADVASAAISAGLFDSQPLGPDAIALAHQIGAQNPRMIDAVIQTAFFPQRIATSNSPDLRLDARVVLADLCRLNPGLTTPALQQMSSETQSGRLAARVVIACGNQEALVVVSGWMQQLLDSAGKSVIEQSKTDALFDLAYALETAGAKAQPYSGPISALLDRKIQVWAPPFGTIDGSPIAMCAVAEQIGGAVAEKGKTESFCQQQKSN